MFLLFTYDQYYPSGGWNDFRGIYPDIETAKKAAKERNAENWHVVEFGKGIVASGYGEE